jgi:hypothetical protein
MGARLIKNLAWHRLMRFLSGSVKAVVRTQRALVNETAYAAAPVPPFVFRVAVAGHLQIHRR